MGELPQWVRDDVAEAYRSFGWRFVGFDRVVPERMARALTRVEDAYELASQKPLKQGARAALKTLRRALEVE